MQHTLSRHPQQIVSYIIEIKDTAAITLVSSSISDIPDIIFHPSDQDPQS